MIKIAPPRFPTQRIAHIVFSATDLSNVYGRGFQFLNPAGKILAANDPRIMELALKYVF